MSGLGVTNCEGLIYLGFMRFSFNPSATGLYLDVGLLNNDNSFFFGKFLDSDFEYPSYEFEYGEKIDFKEDLIESQRMKIIFLNILVKINTFLLIKTKLL